MGWVNTELVLVALAAMLSPTTLSFCIFVLVVAERPKWTGLWFYLGALTATLAIGVIAGFVINNAAASNTSSPKTWVAIVDIIFAVLLLIWVSRVVRRPRDPKRVESMLTQVQKVTGSPVIAVIGAGAALANPGGFIPIALKTISETDPSATQYILEWVGFALVSLLPLSVALIMLVVAPAKATRVLEAVRNWLVQNARTVAAVIIVLLALALLRNGIAGLVNS